VASNRVNFRQSGFDAGLMQTRTPGRSADDNLKFLAKIQSLSQAQNDAILALLQVAFIKPEMIGRESDRDSRLTMLILQWLSNSTDSVLAVTSGAFTLLRLAIAAADKADGYRARLHKRAHFKNALATLLYTASVPLAFVSVRASFFIFILFPALHFLPERRSEVEPI
jgi:hypothetical protein